MMKKLSEIVSSVNCTIKGAKDIAIERLNFDSRKAQSGDVFFALKGSANDGHQFIADVIERGTCCIVCEEVPQNAPEHVTFIKTEDSHLAMGLMASAFYDNPSENFKLVGVTGTNGKTSVATLLYRLFTGLGYKVGLLSTVRNMIGKFEIEATHTTPDSITIQRLMAEMVADGCDYVFIEVSSHAIDQKRIAGLNFDGGVFTNITHDHLDYHKTFDAYIKAKKTFFDQLSEKAFALVNIDDKRGVVMVQNTKAGVKTFSLNKLADFKGLIKEGHFDGTLLTINNKEVWTKLIGNFNASNLLAIYGASILLEQEDTEVLEQLSLLETVDGRFEYQQSNNSITAVVDYAHTPDALKNVIDTINQIRGGSEKLITVVGAGGDRDRTKRPKMGKIAANGSNRVIFTSDNPRSEDPQSIVEDILKGVEAHDQKKVISILDRREAIRAACMMASPGDIILVAGKGHEDYQEINGVKNHFSDKEVIAEIFMLNQANL